MGASEGQVNANEGQAEASRSSFGQGQPNGSVGQSSARIQKGLSTAPSVSSRSNPPRRLTATFSAYKSLAPKRGTKTAGGANALKSVARTKPYPHNDAIWIQRSIKTVYKPHGLPKEINDLATLIRYTDGIELRKICDFIRANQWTHICEQKLQFREEAWEKMRIEHMRPGTLKENFINTFAIYLPYASHLPINNNKTVPNSSRHPL